MALKRTSEPFIISTSIAESAANTFTEVSIPVNLNPLDQEVLMILAIDLDTFAPDVVAATNTAQTLSVSTSSQTAVLGIDDSACLGSQRIDVKTDGVTTSSLTVFNRLLQRPT